jgi:hypothetical protein
VTGDLGGADQVAEQYRQMPPFASETTVAWFSARWYSRAEWRATFSAEALAGRRFSSALGATVFERRAAIFAEFLTCRLLTPALQMRAHI